MTKNITSFSRGNEDTGKIIEAFLVFIRTFNHSTISTLVQMDVWHTWINIEGNHCKEYKKEWGFRQPLCTYRLTLVRRTSWGWWDEWDDTALQTKHSKFEFWCLRPSTLPLGHGGSPQYRIFTSERGRKFCFFETRYHLERGMNPQSPTFQPGRLTLSSLTLYCHLHPLQAANCCRNSRLILGEDGLKRVTN